MFAITPEARTITPHCSVRSSKQLEFLLVDIQKSLTSCFRAKSKHRLQFTFTQAYAGCLLATLCFPTNGDEPGKSAPFGAGFLAFGRRFVYSVSPLAYAGAKVCNGRLCVYKQPATVDSRCPCYGLKGSFLPPAEVAVHNAPLRHVHASASCVYKRGSISFEGRCTCQHREKFNS